MQFNSGVGFLLISMTSPGFDYSKLQVISRHAMTVGTFYDLEKFMHSNLCLAHGFSNRGGQLFSSPVTDPYQRPC